MQSPTITYVGFKPFTIGTKTAILAKVTAYYNEDEKGVATLISEEIEMLWNKTKQDLITDQDAKIATLDTVFLGITKEKLDILAVADAAATDPIEVNPPSLP